MSRCLAVFACLVFVIGCTAEDQTAIDVDLTKLNWQTGVIALLLYLADSRGHLGSLKTLAAKLLPFAGRPVDTNKDGTISDQELLEALSSLLIRATDRPDVRTKIIDLMKSTPNSAAASRAE